MFSLPPKKPENPFRTPPRVDEDYIYSHPVFQIVYCTMVGSLLVAIAVVSLWSEPRMMIPQHRNPMLTTTTRHPRILSAARSANLRGRFPPLSKTGSMLLLEGATAATKEEPSFENAIDDNEPTQDDDIVFSIQAGSQSTRLKYILQQEHEKAALLADDVYDEFGLFEHRVLPEPEEVHVVDKRKRRHQKYNNSSDRMRVSRRQ